MQTDPHGPLRGIRILDASRVLAGPFCGQLLGDLGAEVIKVERPGQGDETRTWGPPYHASTPPLSAYYLSCNRNKRGIRLDAATPAGAEVLRRLIARSDVLIENLRPGGFARLGFDVSIVDPVSDEKAIISSSRVRAHLEAGEVVAANRLLGYRWFVIAKVVGGDRRGRDLGFPTANMRLGPDCRLRHGIYAVCLRRADGSVHDGVASFGRRPTFDDGDPLLEVHLVDFSGDLYGEQVTVTFIDWIRPELRFDSVDGLVAEMTKDREAARRALAEAAPAGRLDVALAAIE